MIGVELEDSRFIAYLESDVVRLGAINDQVDGLPVLVVAEPDSATVTGVFDRTVDGQALTFTLENGWLTDIETGSRWTFGGSAVDGELEGARLVEVRSLRLFWFAWVGFHPETELRRPNT